MKRLRERLAKPVAGSSFIAQRISVLTFRIYAIALAGTLAEASVYAFGQLKYINPVWFWLTWGAVVFSVTFALVESFVFSRGRWGIALHSLAVLFTLLTWQWQLSGATLPSDFKPWFWWQLGMGALSGGIALAPALGWLFIFGLPIYWWYFRQQTFSGGPDPLRGLQDAIYTALLAAVILSLVNLLQLFAKRADEAEVKAREALVDQARVDAVERERTTIDSLVHEKILATLDAAYNASPNQEHQAIATSANSALQALRDYANSYSREFEKVTVHRLFDALAKSAKQQFASLVVDQNGDSMSQIDYQVANAFSEAAMQALDNSFKHAGDKKVNRQLHLKVRPNGFKIVIEDDGRGFRPSKVAKDRVGVRRTIRGRVESVGGVVKIDSSPGQGCRVILEWESA